MFEGQLGVDYFWGIVIFGVIIAVFTAVGDYFAVAYLDARQGIIMTIGMLFLLPITLGSAGGFEGLNTSLVQMNPDFVHWRGFMLPTLQIGLFFVFLFAFIGQPHLIVRFYSIKDKAATRLAFSLFYILSWFLSNKSARPQGLITIENAFAMCAFALILGILFLIGICWRGMIKAGVLVPAIVSPIFYISGHNFLWNLPVCIKCPQDWLFRCHW